MWLVPVSGALNRFHHRRALEKIGGHERKSYDPFSLDRMPSLVGHVLARIKAAEICGVRAPDLPLHFHHEEAPRLQFGNRRLPMSLAHSGDFVACALGRSPVGVDVEELESDFAFEGTAREVFSEKELARFESLPPQDKMLRFHQLWTLKEAFCKAAGLPFIGACDRSTFEINAQGHISFDFAAGQDATPPVCPKDWQFVLKRPSPGHIMALAVNSGGKIRVEEELVDLEELLAI
ncbi:MAG: 4'-phosphopantetheinyl transferase superfamily protein [Deltaproteobacteria bacterium]|nr:4'-phosphopantetheinyl transferase superfamily protein [Deltaproteobacteria bacterium]